MHRLAVVLVSFLIACGGDEGGETGESCDANASCATGQCVLGGSFPEGTCTPSCASNADCPDGFSCISRSSGMCLRDCTSSDQCEAERGEAWQCREESLQGDNGGNAMVCIGD